MTGHWRQWRHRSRDIRKLSPSRQRGHNIWPHRVASADCFQGNARMPILCSRHQSCLRYSGIHPADHQGPSATRLPWKQCRRAAAFRRQLDGRGRFSPESGRGGRDECDRASPSSSSTTASFQDQTGRGDHECVFCLRLHPDLRHQSSSLAPDTNPSCAVR